MLITCDSSSAGRASGQVATWILKGVSAATTLSVAALSAAAVAVGLVSVAASPARGSAAASSFDAMVEGVLEGRGRSKERKADRPSFVVPIDPPMPWRMRRAIASLISGLF